MSTCKLNRYYKLLSKQFPICFPKDIMMAYQYMQVRENLSSFPICFPKEIMMAYQYMQVRENLSSSLDITSLKYSFQFSRHKTKMALWFNFHVFDCPLGCISFEICLLIVFLNL